MMIAFMVSGQQTTPGIYLKVVGCWCPKGQTLNNITNSTQYTIVVSVRYKSVDRHALYCKSLFQTGSEYLEALLR